MSLVGRTVAILIFAFSDVQARQDESFEGRQWAEWSFEEFFLGSVDGQGPWEAPWVVPSGSDAPDVIDTDAHDGGQSLRVALETGDNCTVEHDMTREVAVPPSGLWEISFAFKVNLDIAGELRVVVEDRNLVTGGDTTGPCIQFAVIRGPSGAYPAIWDGESYNDLSDELGIGPLETDRWYRVVIACDSTTETVTRVMLYPPRRTVALTIPFGGSSGVAAHQGMPEYLTVSVIGASGTGGQALVDTIVAEEGYTTDNQPWDDLARALQHIYRGSWPLIYVDMGNQVLQDDGHTEEQFTQFFLDYFSNNNMNQGLASYLGYPTFWWFSPATHDKLQNATVNACREVAFRIVDANAENLGAAFLADYELGETCAYLHYWIEQLIEHGEHISEPTWQRVDADYMTHFARYPQYLDAAATFDTVKEPWIAPVRAQAWIVTRNVQPYDEARKAVLASAWGLTGDRLTIFNDTDVLVLDNNRFNAALYRLIYDFLMSLPEGSDNLRAITCNDELKTGEWFWVASPPPTRVNIWNGDPMSFDPDDPPNPFPDDIGPSPTCNMTGVVVHEVMHSIDGYHYFQTPQSSWYPLRRDALIAEAGCPPMEYLRSMFDECFFVDSPWEFMASIGNEYFVDTSHTLELGLARWDAGYRQPINQWLLVTELFGKLIGKNRTSFWRIDTAANVITDHKRIRWSGDRISRVTVEEGHNGSGWRFEFSKHGMVDEVHPLIGPLITTGPVADPPEITDSQTSVLRATGADEDDPDESLAYAWGPETGEIVGAGQEVRFVPPIVCAGRLVAITLVVQDEDGLLSGERMVSVMVTPETKLGDVDGDGDVDLTDFACFQQCFTGPDLGPVRPGCEGFDADCDDDVDLEDYAAFQRTMTRW